MQLRNARLCLDCEEVHDESRCPVCASDSFAYIKRWVQTGERRARPREPGRATTEAAQTYRALIESDGEPRLKTWQLVRGGAVGLAILGAAGWMWRRGTVAGTHAGEEAQNGGRTENQEPRTEDEATTY